MTSKDSFANSAIPSHLLTTLRSLIGHKIINATRYSWWAPEEAEQECGVASGDVFSLTAGPAAIAFDSGIVLGIASDPSVNSISVWIEQDSAGLLIQDQPLSSDEELHSISANDPKFSLPFWHRIIGATVYSISILVRKPKTARLAELPNEVGLCFMLDSGSTVVAAHGLHDDSDDFTLISDQLILERIYDELEEVKVE